MHQTFKQIEYALMQKKTHYIPNMDVDWHPLQIPEYQWWFDALVTNDSKLVGRVLSQVEKHEREKLLNNRFTWTKKLSRDFLNLDTSDSRLFQIATPLCLATANGADETVLKLLEYGVTVTATDHSDNNCIHALVLAAFINPEKESKLRVTYSVLCDNFPQSQLRDLLMRENEDGLRPLELAANLTTFGLLYDIFETNGVYKTKQIRQGIYCKDLYDVTEYECPKTGRRVSKSPVRLLAHLDQGSLNNNYINDVFRSQHMVDWFHYKLKKNIPLILLVILFKLVFIIAYLLFDVQFAAREDDIGLNGEVEFTNTTEPYCLQQIYTLILSRKKLALLGCFIVLLSIAIISGNLFAYTRAKTENRRRKFLQNSRLYSKNKNIVANYINYNFLNSVVHSLILVFTVLRMLQLHYRFQISIFFSTSLQLACLTIFGMATLRYLVFIPGLGEFTLTVERISNNCLIQFWIIYITISAPYVFIFNRIANIGKHVCDENFQSLSTSVYSIFLMTFNMIDFTGIDVSGEQRMGIHFLHAEFTMFIAVIFINYLIASFSYYLSQILEKKHIIRQVQTTYTICQYEDFFELAFSWWLRKYYGNCFIKDSAGRLYVSKTSVLGIE